MPVSIVASIRADRRTADGRESIKIRIILNRAVIHTEDTGKRVFKNQWDPVRREVINSPASKMYNIAIRNRISFLENEIMKAELSGKIVSRDLIRRIAKGDSAASDFYAFCEEYIPIRYPRPDQKRTRDSYFTELKKMKEFKASLLFNELTPHLIMNYEHWLINERMNHGNTVWKAFKFLSVMILAAINQYGYLRENPLKLLTRKRYVNGTRQFLEMEDLRKLVAHRSKLIGIPHAVLTYFLFMCRTGLRFRDAMNFKPEQHIHGDMIYMVTEKKEVIVNLQITESIQELLPLPELKINNKDFNKYLQAIAGALGIDKHLTAHVARHTFGASLALLDIPLALSQKLLGHADKRSTEVYYHIRSSQLKQAMEKLSKLYLDQDGIDGRLNG